MLPGCSFFQQHEYSTCNVQVDYIPCATEADSGFTLIDTDDGCGVRVKVLGESASGEDSKEVEVPL